MPLRLMETTYAAVRKTDGKEWFDFSSIGWRSEYAYTKAMASDEQLPGWAKDNPIVRIAKIQVIDIGE